MTPEQERLANAMLRDQFGISQAGPLQPEATPPPEQDRFGANLRAAGQLALMALPVTRLGRAMMSTLPRALGTSIGAGAAIEGASGGLPNFTSRAEAAEPVPPDASELKEPEIKAFQARMKAQNRYNGPIDGTINPGGPTHKLWEEERAAIMSRNQNEIDAKRKQDAANAVAASQRAAAEAAKAQADAKAAEAQGDLAKAAAAKAQFEAKQIEARMAAERATQAAAAGKKLDEFRSSPGGMLAQTMLAIGPYAGFGIGYGLGHKLQAGIGRRADTAARALASRADKVMKSPSSGLNDDIAKVNRFWGEGGGREPFDFLPNANPRAVAPYRTAAQQTPPVELYNQSMTNRVAEHGVLPIAGLAEHLLSHYSMTVQAREELKAASEAAQKEPNDVNIGRLQMAMWRAGFGELMSRLGFGMIAGSFGHSMTHGIVGGAPRARPSQLQRAESERARLQNILAQPLPKRGAAGPPPAPPLVLPPPRVNPGQAQPLGVPPLANPPKALPAPKPKKKGKS